MSRDESGLDPAWLAGAFRERVQSPSGVEHGQRHAADVGGDVAVVEDDGLAGQADDAARPLGLRAAASKTRRPPSEAPIIT